jgi:hypothetical protein
MPLDPNEWWICEALGHLIQGPGFCFTNLVDVIDGKLIIRSGADPDNPTEIPLDKLKEFIDKHEKGLIPVDPNKLAR